MVSKADNGIHINGEHEGEDHLSTLVDRLDRYLVFEYVSQHDYAEDIYPDATNTLRLHTIVNPETHEVSMVRPLHRFGSAQSAPTDNWSRGGYIAPIDEVSGRVGSLLVVEGSERTKRKTHPETGSRIAGIDVPYWEAACELVTKAARIHSNCPVIGWDVLISPDGPVLIEANARPSVLGLQMESGLWSDIRFRKLCDALAIPRS